MVRKYTEVVVAKNWVVNKYHIKKLFYLLDKRFTDQKRRLSLKLEFATEELEFTTISELEKCILEEVTESKRNVVRMILGAHQGQYYSNSEKHAWITMDFEDSKARFNIQAAEDKDWVYGFKREMEDLLHAFEPSVQLLNYVKGKDKNRYKYNSSIILFDYDEKLEKEAIQPDQYSIKIDNSQIHFGIGDNIKNAYKNITKPGSKEPWYEKWWIKYVAFPIIVGIVTIYLAFRFGINGEKKVNTEQPQSLGQTSTPAASVNPITPTPAEIIDVINNLPPLQQTTAAANYKGIKVSWPVYLVGGYTNANNSNLYTIQLQDKSLGPIITCDVDLASYPQLKIIKKGEVFTIGGEIVSVDSLGIGLNNCNLYF